MNRYEFEDKISDYIDNQLSVSERKDFEDFLIQIMKQKNW